MLTKVGLPAPLLPVRPTRSPASTATLTSAAATTAPKRLCTPSAIRSAIASVPAALGPERTDAARQEADHEQQEEAERELPGVREVRARERTHDLEHRAGDEHRGDALPAG